MDESTNMLITSTPAPMTLNNHVQSSDAMKQVACRRLFSEHQVHHQAQQLHHKKDEQCVLRREWMEEGRMDGGECVNACHINYMTSECIHEPLVDEEDMVSNGNAMIDDVIIGSDSILLFSQVMPFEDDVKETGCHPQSEQLLEYESSMTFHQSYIDQGIEEDEGWSEHGDDSIDYHDHIDRNTSMTTNAEHHDLTTTTPLPLPSSMMIHCGSSSGIGSSVADTPRTTSMTHGWMRREREMGRSVFDESSCTSPCPFRQASQQEQGTKRQRLMMEDGSSEGGCFSQPRLSFKSNNDKHQDMMREMLRQEDARLFSHSQPVKSFDPSITSIFTQSIALSIGMDGGGSGGHSSIRHVLPCHASPRDAIPRVTPQTVVSVVESGGMVKVDEEDEYKVVIIDCRYGYEYEGGHIPGAINVTSMTDMDAYLGEEGGREREGGEDDASRIIYIFHCKFSSERGPRMALHVRRQDRWRNARWYPRLSIPHVYVMEGGYKAYWQLFPAHCSPPYHYRPMLDGGWRGELRVCEKARKAMMREKRVEEMGGKSVQHGSPVTLYGVRRGRMGREEAIASGISSEL